MKKIKEESHLKEIESLSDRIKNNDRNLKEENDKFYKYENEY
jgi:hypothetical protein